MATICLNMIVKNESHIIADTLTNILNYIPIDYWVIADTGSTDHTPEVITSFFQQRQIPGELIHHQWENFGHNRQLALEAAQGKTDYVFFFDADDYLEGNFQLPDFNYRGYYFILQDEDSAIHYHRPLLVKNDGTFYWRGVLHEYIIDRQGEIFTIIEGDYRVRSCRKGGRSFDPEKYKKDALVLEHAIENGIDPDLIERYRFYAGQSWMAAGDGEKGAYWYLERTKTQGWDQELSLAHYRLGEYYAGKQQEEKAIYHWLCAAEAFPKGIEAWYQLSRINSWNNRHKVAYGFARRAVEAVENLNETYMFANKDIEQYWAYYELFMNAYYNGRFEESYDAFKKLVERHAPSWLYTNEMEKLHTLSACATVDTYQEVQHIQRLLHEKDLAHVVEVVYH